MGEALCLCVAEAAGQGLKEFGEFDGMIMMILDADSFGRGQNGPFAIESRSVKAHAHIGDEGAEHENKVERRSSDK